MSDKNVTVQGGGSYRIKEYAGKYTAYKIHSFSKDNIGKASTFEDALSLIKVHSGKEIKKIT